MMMIMHVLYRPMHESIKTLFDGVENLKENHQRLRRRRWGAVAEWLARPLLNL